MIDTGSENSNSNPPSRNWVTAVSFLTVLIFFLILNAKMMAPFVLSILMGGILAILFFPLYLKLREKRVRPLWASVCVTTSVALIIIVPLVIFSLVAVKQATTLAKEISEKKHISVESIAETVSNMKIIQPLIDDQGQLTEELTGAIQKAATSLTQSILGIVGSLPDRILQLLLGMISCFFFLIDGRRFIVFLNDKIPLDFDVRKKLYGSFKATAISVIWATMAAAGAQSAIMFFTFLILGVPGAFLAGGATFIICVGPFYWQRTRLDCRSHLSIYKGSDHCVDFYVDSGCIYRCH